MFKFFFFLTGIYTSTNNGSINTTESVASNMNDFYIAKRRNHISNVNNNTNQFSEQEDFELGRIIDDALDLEKELQIKNTQSSVLDNLIFDTINSQCFQDKNNENFESPVQKKFKLDDNIKCITSENASHSGEIFQNNSNMYYSYPFNDFEFRNQYDEVLNPDKAIKDKNDNQNYNIKCGEIIVYKDKKDLFIKLYGLYAKKFNKYLIHRKKLIYNSVFQNETIQFNNHQLANLDLFLNFCREALSHYKSAFDEAEKEPILIPKEISFIKNSDKKVPSRLLHFKSSYHSRKVNLIASVECQIRNVEDNSFFKKSSCKCIKELIVECNMLIKEVVEYFCLYNLSIRLHECNITLVYNECKKIIQRFTNISRTVKLECIVVIIKMLIKRLESLQEFLIDVDCSLLSIFKSAIHLSLEIDWFISPLKNIVDNIEKEYCRK